MIKPLYFGQKAVILIVGIKYSCHAMPMWFWIHICCGKQVIKNGNRLHSIAGCIYFHKGVPLHQKRVYVSLYIF